MWCHTVSSLITDIIVSRSVLTNKHTAQIHPSIVYHPLSSWQAGAYSTRRGTTWTGCQFIASWTTTHTHINTFKVRFRVISSLNYCVFGLWEDIQTPYRNTLTLLAVTALITAPLSCSNALLENHVSLLKKNTEKWIKLGKLTHSMFQWRKPGRGRWVR